MSNLTTTLPCPPGLYFPHDFPSFFLSFHILSLICNYDNILTGRLDKWTSNCNTDDIKTCNNDNMGRKSAFL